MTAKSATLVSIARDVASSIADFQHVKGPGDGDRATAEFMTQLRARAIAEFSTDFSEQKICGNTAFAVDFYIPEERTIIEVALGLPNPGSEFEKDVLKAIIAQDYGFDIRKLIFISRPGASKKCSQPGRKAIIDWARSKHRLAIEVHDLPGEPRRRRRTRRSVATM